MKRNKIIKDGKLLNTVYGASRVFKWNIYELDGRRFEVSMFNNEVNEIKKWYCNCCGEPVWRDEMRIVFGELACPSCCDGMGESGEPAYCG